MKKSLFKKYKDSVRILIKENKKFIGIIVLFIIAALAVSWLAVCGIVKLITLCFGLAFKWSIATGIWLVICILKSTFGK